MGGWLRATNPDTRAQGQIHIGELFTSMYTFIFIYTYNHITYIYIYMFITRKDYLSYILYIYISHTSTYIYISHIINPVASPFFGYCSTTSVSGFPVSFAPFFCQLTDHWPIWSLRTERKSRVDSIVSIAKALLFRGFAIYPATQCMFYLPTFWAV